MRLVRANPPQQSPQSGRLLDHIEKSCGWRPDDLSSRWRGSRSPSETLQPCSRLLPARSVPTVRKPRTAHAHVEPFSRGLERKAADRGLHGLCRLRLRIQQPRDQGAPPATAGGGRSRHHHLDRAQLRARTRYNEIASAIDDLLRYAMGSERPRFAASPPPIAMARAVRALPKGPNNGTKNGTG
jgi:hypothetical protein